MIEIPISPALLLIFALYIVQFLLRHRLYLYATVGRVESIERASVGEHVFVIQNVEDVDLSAAFRLAISTTNNAGRIQSVEIFSGKQGPANWEFKSDGVERWSLVVLGMPANDTWKIVVQTNGEAECVRLNVRGWDLRRKETRWWFPTFALEGITITSRSAAVQRELSRPARGVAWMCLAMLLLIYRMTVIGLSRLSASTAGHWWPIGPWIQRVREIAMPWDRQVDMGIMFVLLILGVLGTLMTVRTWWLPIPLGYLGDPYWTSVFARYSPLSMREQPPE